MTFTQKLLGLVGLVALGSLGTGCAVAAVAPVIAPAAAQVVVGTGTRVAGIELMEVMDKRPAPPAYVYVPGDFEPVVDLTTLEPIAPAAPHTQFDVAAARRSLDDADLSMCGAPTTASAWGHAQVTYGNDGHAVRVEIDQPAGLSQESANCVGRKLGSATVPAFDGAETTVGVTFVMQPRVTDGHT